MIPHFLSSVALASSVLAFATAPVVHAAEKQILIVLTNHGDLGDTGKKTGFFLGEASHPWEVFQDAGYTVKLGSPKGGFAPLDLKSKNLDDPANKAFWEKYGSGEEEKGNLGVQQTVNLSEVTPGEFKAVFFAGGHGTMWDFRHSDAVQKVAAEVYENGGVVAAVCHGPAALVDVKLKDGSALVKGKKVAGFTNAEEEAVNLEKVVPYLLQTDLEKSGGEFVAGENFKENAVRDGRLVTGQNPASAKKTAELVVEALEDK